MTNDQRDFINEVITDIITKDVNLDYEQNCSKNLKGSVLASYYPLISILLKSKEKVYFI